MIDVNRDVDAVPVSGAGSKWVIRHGALLSVENKPACRRARLAGRGVKVTLVHGELQLLVTPQLAVRWGSWECGAVSGQLPRARLA